MTDNVTELITKMTDAKPHLEAGHSVSSYWTAEVRGHLTWLEGEQGAEIYQTEIVEDGPTTQANCNDCDILLDIETLTELGV